MVGIKSKFMVTRKGCKYVVQNNVSDWNRRLSEFRYQCDNNMLITCTRCVEFSNLICGFQGSDMSSNYTSLTREHVRVSMPQRTVYGDRNRRLREFQYQSDQNMHTLHGVFQSNLRLSGLQYELKS